MRQPFFSVVGALAMLALVVAVAGRAATSSRAAKSAAPRYQIAGDEFEGCECNSVCACIWDADATYDQCRGILGWTIKQGQYEGTELKGITFAAAMTKSGKNLAKTMGTWEGVLFVPESATQAQRDALAAIMKAEMGSAFAKMDVKSVPIAVKGTPGSQELSIGTIGHLKIAAVKGPNGRVPRIVNATSPLALPVEYVAKSEVDTFNDGTSSWDFPGRNSFYGPFEMKAKP